MVIQNKSFIFALRNVFYATKIIKTFENKTNFKKKQKMEFKEYVKALPNQRDEVTSQLAKICRVSRITVYRWLRGDFVPDPLKRKVIADYLGKSENELWPDV